MLVMMGEKYIQLLHTSVHVYSSRQEQMKKWFKIHHMAPIHKLHFQLDRNHLTSPVCWDRSWCLVNQCHAQIPVSTHYCSLLKEHVHVYKHRDLFRTKVFSHTNKHCWNLWYGAFRVNWFCHKLLKHIKKLLCILCSSLAFRMTYTWVICILLYPKPTHIAMCGSNKVLGEGWSFLAFLNSLPRQSCASCPNIAYSVRYMINIWVLF